MPTKEKALGWVFTALAFLVAIPMLVPVLIVKGYGLALVTFEHFAKYVGWRI